MTFPIRDIRYHRSCISGNLFIDSMPFDHYHFISLSFPDLTSNDIPASKEYGTHMGPRWVIIWVLYGQPIWDRCGFCNRDSSGHIYMGPIRAPYRISHINRPSHIMHIEYNRFGAGASFHRYHTVFLPSDVFRRILSQMRKEKKNRR